MTKRAGNDPSVTVTNTSKLYIVAPCTYITHRTQCSQGMKLAFETASTAAKAWEGWYARSCEHILLLLQCEKSLFVVARNHATACLSDELLQALRATEPGWVVAREPALRDAVAPL